MPLWFTLTHTETNMRQSEVDATFSKHNVWPA